MGSVKMRENPNHDMPFNNWTLIPIIYLHIGKSSVLMVLDSSEVDTFQLALYYSVNEIHSLIALRSITKA